MTWASNFVSTMTANADRNGKQEQNPHKCAKNQPSRNKDELKCISYLTSIPDFLDSAQWRGSIDPPFDYLGWVFIQLAPTPIQGKFTIYRTR